MRKALPLLIPLLVAAAVLSPGLRDPHADSYPLSTYPMFGSLRSAQASIDTVVGVTESAEIERLSPELISGSDEVILAAATVSDAVDRGFTERLCSEVAARIAATRPARTRPARNRSAANTGDPGSGLEAVVVRTEHIDVVAHLADGAPALAVTEHSRCEVEP